VSLLETAGGAYIATLIGLAAGTGAPLLLVVSVIVISVVEKGFPQRDEADFLITYPTLMSLALGIPLTWLSTRYGRRRFSASSARGRRLIALGACLLAAGGFGAWLAWVLLRF
jgi:hypothetical protein